MLIILVSTIRCSFFLIFVLLASVNIVLPIISLSLSLTSNNPSLHLPRVISFFPSHILLLLPRFLYLLTLHISLFTFSFSLAATQRLLKSFFLLSFTFSTLIYIEEVHCTYRNTFFNFLSFNTSFSSSFNWLNVLNIVCMRWIWCWNRGGRVEGSW